MISAANLLLSVLQRHFGKVGQSLQNKVIVQLIETKCFPVLFGGLPFAKSQFSSLSYVVNSTFRKVFDTRSQDVVDICLEIFNCVPAPL